ncbi:MAG: MerR family transcriptional regulator [Fusobacteriaceae bacterium]|jgi:DNA-binding transcriptional MerR regulator|nr:MerR family transcriptional regulator [Fusobacteriaceae bacterium]
MSYSIGEVAEMTGITVSSLRYYDREGLFPAMKRTSGGIRMFSETEIDALKIMECLKVSGMSIKDIRQFLVWCQEGDGSLRKRRDLFYERLEAVKRQMEELQKTMDTIKYKCWYYDTAVTAGSEEVPKKMPEAEMPEDIRKYRKRMEINLKD